MEVEVQEVEAVTEVVVPAVVSAEAEEASAEADAEGLEARDRMRALQTRS